MSSLARRLVAVPRLLALALLLVFAAQAAYLSAHSPLAWPEPGYLGYGVSEFSVAHGPSVPANAIPRGLKSPLVAAATRIFSPSGDSPAAGIARLPFVVLGVLLGAAVFYIAERWYGKRGGCLALALYALSPQMVTSAARVGPTILAAAGAYASVITAIAVAHTLYAPREVVLWNWRRILLLGAGLALGIAAEFAVVVTVPLALAFLLYLVPERRRAAGVILLAGLLVAFVLLLLAYRFDFHELAASARALTVLSPSGLLRAANWKMVAVFYLSNGAGFALLLLVALAGYTFLPKARYFGNTAPLIAALLLISTGLLAPHAAGLSFLVVALPFLLLFIAGVATELLDTRLASAFAGLLTAVLAAQAYFSLAGLWRVRS
jgi:hypothetical protein